MITTYLRSLSLMLLETMWAANVLAQDTSKEENKPGDTAAETPTATSTASKTATSTPKAPAPPYAAILKDAKSHSGLFTLYQKGNRLYAEMNSSHYGSE